MEYNLEEIKTKNNYYKIYKDDYLENNQNKTRLFGVYETEKTAKTVLYYLQNNTDFVVEMNHSPVNLAEIKTADRTRKDIIFETKELEHQIRYKLHRISLDGPNFEACVK